MRPPTPGWLLLIDAAELDAHADAPPPAPQTPWRTALPVIVALSALTWAGVILAFAVLP